MSYGQRTYRSVARCVYIADKQSKSFVTAAIQRAKSKNQNYKRMDRPCSTPVLYSESLAAVRQAKTSRDSAFNAPSLTLIREALTIDRLKHAGATPSSTKNKTTFLGLAARPNMPSYQPPKLRRYPFPLNLPP